MNDEFLEQFSKVKKFGIAVANAQKYIYVIKHLHAEMCKENEKLANGMQFSDSQLGVILFSHPLMTFIDV